MARKHKRRTRKRNKKGGFVGPKFSKKFGDGLQGLDDLRKGGLEQGKKLGEGMNQAYLDVESGYKSKTQPGGMLGPVPAPPSSPTSYLNPKTGIVTDTPLSMDPIEENPLPPLQMVETNQPSKEIKGGLLGLGTWFGLGGRRLSHSAFINKMLRVRNKTKRNKAIRKYLKGGKKKTKKRKGRKKRKTKRKRR